MMLPELLALWHVALAEALLLVALLVAINGLDDLAIDVLWLMMPRHQRQPQHLHRATTMRHCRWITLPRCHCATQRVSHWR
jgi:hypothetical protein